MKDIEAIENISIAGYALYKVKDVNDIQRRFKAVKKQFSTMKQHNDKLKGESTYNRNRYRFLKRIMNKIIKDHKERALPQFYALREHESIESLMEKANVDWYNKD